MVVDNTGVIGQPVKPGRDGLAPQAQQPQTAREYWLAVLDRAGVDPDRAAQQVRLYESARNTPQSRFGRSLVETLSIQNVLPQEVLVSAVAARHQMPVVKRQEVVACAKSVARIGEDKCRTYHVLPLESDDSERHLRIAVADPEIHGFPTIRTLLRQTFRTTQLLFCVAGIQDMIDAMDTLRQAQRAIPNIIESESAPSPAMIEEDLERAYREGSSDLHLKPGEGWHAVTIRVDGFCREIRRLSAPEHKAAYISLLKLSSARGLSGEERGTTEGARTRSMDSQNVVETKDASSVREYSGRRVALRYSSIPTRRGESVAVRLIDHTKIMGMRLAGLGYLPADEQLLRATFQGQTGLNMIVGTTGSGKTTSLYCGMKEADMNAFRVVTIEDPIECLFPEGPVQIEVTPLMSFDDIAEAVLRHDPDMIVSAEVRSEVTARLLTWATLSGHLTWSTLHADTPFMAIHRLMDLKLQIRHFAGAIDVFVAQRLARKLCPHCRREHPRSAELKAKYAQILERYGVAEPSFCMSIAHRECAHCRGKGNRGRILLAEIHKFCDEDRDQIIREGSNYNVIAARASAIRRVSNPLKTMRQDAMVKAALGLISVEEAEGQTLTTMALDEEF
jgi:type II secretory ATPase GspE/PulE/Tfp pilus assembly ATPase PilB-like protein